MSDVVLTVKCQRRRHEVLTVVDEDGVLFAQANRLATTGWKRSEWTPARWQLVVGNSRRCGCACGHSWLIDGEDVARWRTAGYTEVRLPPSRLGPIGPVRLGAN
jgi:hypothetical protein